MAGFIPAFFVFGGIVFTIRRYQYGILLSLLVAAGNVEAAGSELQCKDIERFMEQAAVELAQNQSHGTVSAGLPDADTCSTATGTAGSKIYHCHWGFPYRDKEAEEFFGHLDVRLKTCLESQVNVADDQPVNHPDSFHLRTYHLDRAKVSISLKDKATIDKTLVFIRVEIPTDDSH